MIKIFWKWRCISALIFCLSYFLQPSQWINCRFYHLCSSESFQSPINVMQCKVILKSFSFFIDKEIKSPGMKPYWMNEGKGLGYHPQCLSSQFSFKPACYNYWKLKNITLLTTSKNITLVPLLDELGVSKGNWEKSAFDKIVQLAKVGKLWDYVIRVHRSLT